MKSQLHRCQPIVAVEQHRLCATFVPIICLSLLLTDAHAGQCKAQCYFDPYTGRTVCPRQFAPVATSPDRSERRRSSTGFCRISVGDGTVGSGTLVGCDESNGLILTCSHLFDTSSQSIVATFPNGERFTANLVDRDRAHDLAALTIRRPSVSPLAVSSDEPTQSLTACGFGPNGQFRCVEGATLGRATTAGATYPSLTMSGAVRPGDSGGGVLNSAGQVVGVIWGQRDGVTYTTCGRPVREFLDRVCGRRGSVAVQKPLAPSNTQPSPTPQLDLQAWSTEIEARLRDLDAKKQDRGDYLQPGDLNGYARASEVTKVDTSHLSRREEVEARFKTVSSRIESVRQHVETVRQAADEVKSKRVGVFEGLSWGKLVAGALGLSGPLAAAVVIAGGLAGRRLKSKLRQRVTHNDEADAQFSNTSTSHRVATDSPPPPQRTVPETHYVPVEKDTFAKAHQWASEHVARKYPGATELLQAQDSLIKQFLASKP